MTIATILAPHAKRPLRAFIARANSLEESALWTLIYQGHTSIPHDVAIDVAAEVETSTRTVQDVINGWKPGRLS